MNINQSSTQYDFDDNSRFQLEHQIINQEMKKSGLRFEKTNSMTIWFYKTTQFKRSSYIKIPLRPSAILNFEKVDKCCSLWSKLAILHPCNNNHPIRVWNCRQNLMNKTFKGSSSHMDLNVVMFTNLRH